MFKDGSWAKGIIKLTTMPSELISKFVLRAGAWLAGLFGFDDTAKALTESADNLNLFDMGSKLLKSIGNWFSDTWNSITEWISSFSIIKTIKDIFNSVLDIFTNSWKILDQFLSKLNIVEGVKTLFNNIFKKISSWSSEVDKSTPTQKKTEIVAQQPKSAVVVEKNTKAVEQKKEAKQEAIATKATQAAVNTIIAPSNSTVNNTTALSMRPRSRMDEQSGLRAGWNSRRGDYSGFVMG
jgi:prophage DNA circulation protein